MVQRTDPLKSTITKNLQPERTAQLKRMYRDLAELEGIGEPGVTDASITTNEALYGENGAWRGGLGQMTGVHVQSS
jgi:hypothetical protein